MRKAAPKQKIEARKKRVAAVKVKTDRAKRIAGAKKQLKKDVKKATKVTVKVTKKVAKTGARAIKKADSLASKLLSGLKW